jgi:predicted hotdog family 3-hydroxylacyl-ACP dehydratase
MSTLAALPLDRDAIAARIPHAGAMCLLARATDGDHDRLVCTATGHRDADNPLRSAHGLLASAAIEYAAQAMALHGALIGATRADPPAGAGVLASARGVRLHRLRLDDLPNELVVTVRRQAGDARQVLYAFELAHDGACIAEGRATVVLGPA